MMMDRRLVAGRAGGSPLTPWCSPPVFGSSGYMLCSCRTSWRPAGAAFSSTTGWQGGWQHGKWSRVLTSENFGSNCAWHLALGRFLAHQRVQGMAEAAASGDFGVVCGSFDAVGAAISAAGRP